MGSAFLQTKNRVLVKLLPRIRGVARVTLERLMLSSINLKKGDYEEMVRTIVSGTPEYAVAYTDGSAVVRGEFKGRGGFGVYIQQEGKKDRMFSLGFKHTKTGRMEVMALLWAIRAFPKHHLRDSKNSLYLTVYSDSEYVVKAFTEGRLKRWQQAGWRNTSGEVANQDLWAHVLGALGARIYLTLQMKHIRGHQIDKAKTQEEKDLLKQDPHVRGNLIADRLADYKRHTTLHEEVDLEDRT